MLRRIVTGSIHRMGRVEKPKILKSLPLKEVKALAKPPNTNRILEIYWGPSLGSFAMALTTWSQTKKPQECTGGPRSQLGS